MRDQKKRFFHLRELVKAKITRILDYLEVKGLIIRKSYGMTNKIIVRRDMRIGRLG